MTCGYGPYNYGVCDCPRNALFDIYLRDEDGSYPGTPALPLEAICRMGSLFPRSVANGNVPGNTDPHAAYCSFYSDRADNWKTDLSSPFVSPSHSICGGFQASGERVWIGTDSTQRCVSLIDAVGQQESVYFSATEVGATGFPTSDVVGGIPRFRPSEMWFHQHTCGISSGNHRNAFTAATETTLAMISTNAEPGYNPHHMLLLFDDDGSVTFQQPLMTVGVFGQFGEIVQVPTPGGRPTSFAPRYWPKATWLESNVISFGDISVGEFEGNGPPGQPIWVCDNRTTIATKASGAGESFYLDNFDISPTSGWIASYRDGDTMYCKINGTIVDSGPKLGDQRQLGTQWVVHAAHRHETLGDDYFVLCRPYNISAETLPGGTYQAVWTRVQVFKETTLQWSADVPRAIVYCNHSSDRWLYFIGGSEVASGYGTPSIFIPPGTFNFPNGAMPNPWKPYSGEGKASLWMARHDGSESVPGGKIETTFIDQAPANGMRAVQGLVGTQQSEIGPYGVDVVHNSEEVRFSLPATTAGLSELETDN